jgi:hypothetical protein
VKSKLRHEQRLLIGEAERKFLVFARRRNSEQSDGSRNFLFVFIVMVERFFWGGGVIQDL